MAWWLLCIRENTRTGLLNAVGFAIGHSYKIVSLCCILLNWENSYKFYRKRTLCGVKLRSCIKGICQRQTMWNLYGREQYSALLVENPISVSCSYWYSCMNMNKSNLNFRKWWSVMSWFPILILLSISLAIVIHLIWFLSCQCSLHIEFHLYNFLVPEYYLLQWLKVLYIIKRN